VEGRYALGVIRALSKMNKTTASEQDEAGGVIRAAGVFNLNNTNASVYSYNGVYNRMTIESTEGYNVNLLELCLGEDYDKSYDNRNDLFFKFAKYTETPEEGEDELEAEDASGKSLFSLSDKEKLIPKHTPNLKASDMIGRVKLTEEEKEDIMNSADYLLDINGCQVQLNRRLHSIAGASGDVYVEAYKAPDTVLKNGEIIELADIRISYGVTCNAKFVGEVERIFRIII
jgi:hypothetical protein